MDLSVFPAAHGAWAERGMECDAASEPGGDGDRGGVRGDGVVQRVAAAVSEALLVSRPDAFRELFHDHDLPDAGALSGVDVGAVGGNRDLRGAGLVGAAFRALAGEEVAEERLGRITICSPLKI